MKCNAHYSYKHFIGIAVNFGLIETSYVLLELQQA